ncbi:response regulator [Candidatus Sumerlaeota bacterium]|nr:response regulator [Candidatus Sumerlaeota bacterium]
MAFTMPDKPFVVLMVEDSEHDIRATRRVWDKNAIRNPLKIVTDGAECMDYLLRRGQYADAKSSPRPGVLLLDLNLPKLDGFDILKQIRGNPQLKRLPVIVLTTSNREEDLTKCYDLGANAYLTKPVGLEKLSDCLLKFNLFWELVGLPDDGDHSQY